MRTTWAAGGVALVLLCGSAAAAAELHVGSGQAYATVQGAVDAASPGDVIKVHAGSYQEQLQLDADGTAAEPILLEAAGGGDATIDGRVRIEGDYWVIRDLTFVSQAGSDGFRINGDHNVLERLDLSGGDRDGVDGGGIGNQVLDCTIHNYDAGQSDAHCIVLNPGAEDWVIRGNTLFDCSGDAIQLYSAGAERSIKNTLIQGNEMYFTGAISRTENAIDVKNADGLTIENNLMHDFPENKTVVFQKGPANILVRCNVMHTGFTGVEFREEDGGTLENIEFSRNLMHGFSSYALKFDGTQGATVTHNTFVDIDNDGLRIEGAGVTGAEVQNNVWLNTGSVEGDAGISAAANAFFNTGNVAIGSASDVLDDPLLDADHRPQAGSPLIDVGVDLGAPYAGAAPDLGYFEVGADACGRPGTGGEGGAGGGGAGGNGTSASGGGGPGGSPATTGTGGATDGGNGGDEGSCGCRLAGNPEPGSRGSAGWMWLLLAAAAVRRRSRQEAA